jgi:AcrR family transcriptional regulator
MTIIVQRGRSGRTRRLSREEQSEQNRKLLIDAAADVVGKYGYAEASVSRITDAARLAHGTFYNYFESRQDILDLLPPRYAEKMLQYIGERMDPRLNGLEREVKRFELFFEFFHETTESARLVNEAPVMAPVGFAQFSKIVRENYTRALQRSIKLGEIPSLSPEKLSDLVDILIAIRNGLSQPRQAPKLKRQQVSESLIGSYREFIRKALFSAAD